VDTVDVPAFFTSYSGGALSVWLDSLSQLANGEYSARSPALVAAHTDDVAEALASHRLVLANHALLMAHNDALADLGPDTLLVVDEAHQLEDAATGALTADLDYRAVEDLLGDLRAWVGEHRSVPEAAAVDNAVGHLALLLEHENLPRTASQAFDARSSGVGTLIGSRTVTLASPYAGIAGVPQVRALSILLTRLSGVCTSVVGSLGAYAAVHRAGMDFFEAERLAALTVRTAATSSVATQIVEDITEILGPNQPRNGLASGPVNGNGQLDRIGTVPAAGNGAGAASGQGSGSGTGPVDDLDTDDFATEDETAAADSGDDFGDDGGVPQLPAGPPPPTPNQVVYASETDSLRRTLRSYRFTVSSSPIDLPADTRWREFTATFARTYYVSATLRVAGGWDYIRGRLGLPATVGELALDTPFNMSEQAELVCFDDFPSWAEQSDGAMRTVAHQLARYATEMIHPVAGTGDGIPAVAGDHGGYDGGAMILTTARSTAGGISDYLAQELRRAGSDIPLHSAIVLGNPRAVGSFTDDEAGGGLLVGTRGLWQGVDIADANRLRMVWINKLPFSPFADPVIEARRASVTARAEADGADDPEQIATETYYLPLAALDMRQAVGRMIRSERHRGVIVISDRKLGGLTALRRSYRTVFLGSLDPGVLRTDPATGEAAGGNVVSMAEGWERIWRFYARHGLIREDRADQLCDPDALAEHTLLPQTRRIRQLALTADEATAHKTAGTLADEVATRAAHVAGLLHLSDDPATLKDSQVEIIRAVAEGRNVLGLLPTGFGKSFCFQLPALVLPGVTLVVSPLVALMHDQALELNRSIGGAVRALVAPLRESSSRAGKTEVADQLLGRADNGIRLVYVSPERLCQRRFRELVRDAVASGRITRIALDEAHTFVQWGDDFRPSFRRVEQFLTQLREDFGLPVTALTATANRTVHAGLREGVFGLLGDPPPDGDGDALVTVTENPIRPELAVFRRSLGQAGPSIVAGLAEEVLDKIDDHAIFYCLTVKETNTLHAHLRNHLGQAGVRIRRFHGRLTEAEKAAVMNEFRDAPRRGEEGFVPLVIVATSAFGLGINRPDVRTVFCVSPPTDLAALYQQIGRAGRDAAGRALTGTDDAEKDAVDTITTTGAGTDTGNNEGIAAAVPSVGLTLMTTRSLRTAAWMSGQDLPRPLLVRMGRAVLTCGGILDAGAVADTLIAQDLTSGALNPAQACSRFTHETYTTGVVRAFAALATLNAVTDLGDFPPLAAIKPGELLHPPAANDTGSDGGSARPDVADAVVAALLALPVRGNGPLTRSRLRVVAADRLLATAVPGYRDVADDVAGTWQVLADLHDRGLLDVSAAPSRTLVTGLIVHTRDLPDRYWAALSGKAARAGAEIAALRSFFADARTCANEKFANYFGVTVPDGCCTTAANRCSACWDYRDDWPATDRRPAAADALDTPRPRPAGWRIDTATKTRRLSEQIRKLCWLHDRGLSTNELRLALRGQDTMFYVQGRRTRTRRLPYMVVNSVYFGASPDVTRDEIDAACQRLAVDGHLVAQGWCWRDAGNVARQATRKARQVAAAASAGAGATATSVQAGPA
jgi:RecQ family ATP-dependent DNA helicase